MRFGMRDITGVLWSSHGLSLGCSSSWLRQLKAFLPVSKGTSSTSCPSGVPRWKDLGASTLQAGKEAL